METPKKRNYRSQARVEQAARTRNQILVSARELFQLEGFEKVTMEKLAKVAGVSAPTVYALFQSKLGILRALMEFPVEQFDALIEQAKQEKSVKARLAISAKIARQINDNERAQMDIFRGASVLDPELKNLEKEKEKLRYEKLEDSIKRMVKDNSLAKELKPSKALAILWAFTGRDMYRMFVIEQRWSSDEYEKWLAETLIKMLVASD